MAISRAGVGGWRQDSGLALKRAGVGGWRQEQAAVGGGAFSAWFLPRKTGSIGLNIMYPKNAASPERIHLGPVVQISDGAVQTSGVSITVVPQGGSTAAGGGTTSYEQGVVFYLPTQAETNYTSFIVTAYKTGCFPTSTTVITTASATAGKVVLSGETHTSAVIPTVSTLTGHTAQTGDAYARLGAPAGASVSADVAAVKVDTAAVKVKTDFLPSATAGAAGGVFIAGTNAAATITGTLTVSDGIVVTRSTANQHAVSLTGDGTGCGLYAQAGNGSAADGARFYGGTNGNGILAYGQATSNGIKAKGITSGHGLVAEGGSTGDGLRCNGGSTSGDGINATVVSGVKIRGDITGNVTGTITTATNVTTVNGLAANVITAAAIATDAGQEIADAVLLRKLDRTGTGTDALDERTVVNALRAVRNKVSISGVTATVTKEDDTTTAWTATVATTAGNPISSVDPA